MYRIILSCAVVAFFVGCGGADSRVDNVSGTCGNGLISEAEQCDDGNTRSGDGCSRSCKIEAEFQCRSEPSDCSAIVCTPDCGSAVCGDDGCGGSCGECIGLSECIDGVCVEPCEPQCDGRECGDDGCGGSCGACELNEDCEEGLCVERCIPNCDERECGDDGCDGVCGTCEAGYTCSAVGICEADVICPEGQIVDCLGSCSLESWITDGSCDSAFDCAELSYDGGDCDGPQEGECTESQIVDCNGFCIEAERLGDANCDFALNCALYGYDAADCPLPCGPGEILDCAAACVDGSTLGDGNCDDNLACEELAWDADDCGPPTCEDDGLNTDCNGECFHDYYLYWVGDGYCDEGSVDLNCALWNFDGGDCETPPDPCWNVVCETSPGIICEGNEVVTYGEVGSCIDGLCEYPEQEREDCGAYGVCTVDRCLDINDPCAGETCEVLPDALCGDEDVVVRYENAGTCNDGICEFEPTLEPCGEWMICDAGACVEAPDAANCTDQGGVNSYRADGYCDPSNNIFECGFDDGDCCESTCTDSTYTCGVNYYNCLNPNAIENQPCLDVECADPPPPICEGNEVVQFQDDGICNDMDGSCSYEEESRSDCGEDICTGGVCLDSSDPCAGIVCETPPENYCIGMVATRFETGGTCDPTTLNDDEDGICVYPMVEETCDEGMICNAGNCEVDLLGQTCVEAGGLESHVGDGWCDNSSNIVNCGWDGGDCCESTCVLSTYTCGIASYNCLDPAASENDLCAGVVCDTAPEPVCDAETGEVVHFSGIGGCSDGTCEYGIEHREQCVANHVCSNGICLPVESPCAFVDCSLPTPECDGDAVKTYIAGHCVEDDGSGHPGCHYDHALEPCAFDEVCSEGQCIPNPIVENCVGTSSWFADGYCDADNNNSFCLYDGGDCCESTCTDDTYLCGSNDYNCQDPTAAEADPCYAVDCTIAPQPECVDNAVVEYDGSGTCVEGQCVFDIASQYSCGENEQCTNGACFSNTDPCYEVICNTPWPPICVGDTVIITYASIGQCSDGECDYDETEETCGTGQVCDSAQGACVDSCPDGAVLDCVGVCGPESWLADGWCDDGVWGVNFSCEEFNFDNGDCPEET